MSGKAKPSSLFDKKGLMNEADKPSLAKSLAEVAKPAEYLGVPSVETYVIDGGWLLQQIPWKKGFKYADICEDYIRFLKKNFQREICVVFDGYPESSTKDSTHIRRTKGKSCRLIKPEPLNILSVKKEVFMLNQNNKQSFIFMLGSVLYGSGGLETKRSAP